MYACSIKNQGVLTTMVGRLFIFKILFLAADKNKLKCQLNTRGGWLGLGMAKCLGRVGIKWFLSYIYPKRGCSKLLPTAIVIKTDPGLLK